MVAPNPPKHKKVVTALSTTCGALSLGILHGVYFGGKKIFHYDQNPLKNKKITKQQIETDPEEIAKNRAFWAEKLAIPAAKNVKKKRELFLDVLSNVKGGIECHYDEIYILPLRGDMSTLIFDEGDGHWRNKREHVLGLCEEKRQKILVLLIPEDTERSDILNQPDYLPRYAKEHQELKGIAFRTLTVDEWEDMRFKQKVPARLKQFLNNT